MRSFQIKLALFVFSLVCAGCSEPFIKVVVNGEDVSSGGGGGCRPPQICGGGAQRPGGESGEIVKVGKAFAILDDHSKQVEYFWEDDPGVSLPKDFTPTVGTKVSIDRAESKVAINKK